MKFLVDNQLPAALARFLVAQGLDCSHVLDLNLADATDHETWASACQNDYVVMNKDEDFFHLATAYSAGAWLIWVRFGNCRTRTLLAAVERVWPRVEAALKAGERVI